LRLLGRASGHLQDGPIHGKAGEPGGNDRNRENHEMARAAIHVISFDRP
jgi:hypothetical protein